VVTFASIAGPAMAKTRPLVTVNDDTERRRVYLPRGALMRRAISQIGITITAPSRK
jgi:hypothetical protein